jgi:S-adenosylmethionine:tRNA ribosyltransferase-isomerase
VSRLLEPTLDFTLAPEQEASEPPEARGLARDEVRLLVSYREDNRLLHATFRDLPCFLDAGDVVVVNSSATRPAALPAGRSGGEAIRLHLSTRLPANLWLVELRRLANGATEPLRDGRAGERLALPAGAQATLLAPYSPGGRLWVAALDLPRPLDDYLASHGRPIRYRYVRDEWPIDAYQTIFAHEPGSAEMPSAGRAFTPELVTHLVRRGVLVVPLVLHTGVASLEEHEPPYEEFYRVPAATARAVNAARAGGGRIIAVGTTVVRALETVAEPDGKVHAGSGWTDLVVTPHHSLRAVDGLLTGLHEPRSSHLAMLAALAGRRHVELAYDAALHAGYLWHEFGDLHLILPSGES